MRVPLNQGAYTARSVIANAQRAVNLYAEANPDDSEVKYTHYNAPGLVSLSSALSVPARCLYWANNDQLYYVAGSTVYSVSSSWALTALGTIGTSSGIVSMADNGTTAVIVDGSANGYQISLANNAFSQISEATNGPPSGSGAVYAFYGANRVDMLDGYMLFNQPGTQNFYSTYNNEIVFDALYFAAKNGYSDILVAVIVTLREIYLIGQRTTEIWFDAGASAFPFQIMPGPFIQHGCSAVYSIAQVDGAVFWLSQDQAGNNIIMRAQGYKAEEISTKAIEAELATYATTSDAQGFCFQIGGHVFYQINFPTADKSWRWDETTHLWHEVVWTDSNGVEHRHRASVAAYAYGVNVVGDWQTGALYQLSNAAYSDAGQPMYFRRGFPHMMMDGRRVIYPGFSLDVMGGQSPNVYDAPGPFPLVATGYPPTAPRSDIFAYGGEVLLCGPYLPPPHSFGSGYAIVNLRWSDDHGFSWSQPVPQKLGATGKTLTQPKWNRTGMARDRVFEVFGVIGGPLAINGAFLDPEPIKMAS